MKELSQGRMDPIICVRCEKPSDAYTQVAGETAVTPGEGDVIVCYYCGQIQFWGENGLVAAPENIVESIKRRDPQAYEAARELEMRWELQNSTDAEDEYDGHVLCGRVKDSPLRIPGALTGPCHRCGHEVLYSPNTAEHMKTMKLELVCGQCMYNGGLPQDVELKTLEGAKEELQKAAEKLGLNPEVITEVQALLNASSDRDALMTMIKLNLPKK